MSNHKELLEKLSAPFENDQVKWKVQTCAKMNDELNALVVPYVSSPIVQKRLDDVLGLNWNNEHKEFVTEKDGKQLSGVECTITLFDDDGKVIAKRSDAAPYTGIEEVKGGYSDSLKRAAVKFGVGRYLHELPDVWVTIHTKRIPNGVYVNGKYKVNGAPTQIKGYYEKPNIAQLLEQEENKKSQTTSNQSKANSEDQKQRAEQRQADRAANGQNDETMNKSRQLTIAVLQFFKIPRENVMTYIEKLTGFKSDYFNDCSYEVLQVVFAKLKPIEIIVLKAYSLSLTNEEIVSFANHYLQRNDLTSVLDLVGLFTFETYEPFVNAMEIEQAKRLKSQFA